MVNGDQQIRQQFLSPFIENSGHSKVNQTNGAVRLNEEISRMRICMKKAVLAYHFQHDVRRVLCEPAAICPLFIEAFQIIDLDAANSLQRQHTRRGGIPKHAGHVNTMICLLYTSDAADE